MSELTKTNSEIKIAYGTIESYLELTEIDDDTLYIIIEEESGESQSS